MRDAWHKADRWRRRVLPRRGGFTFIEVVVVLLLVGILGLIVSSRLEPRNPHALAEADALRSVLRYAQARAMADVYTWGLTLSSSGYTLFSNNPSQPHPLLLGEQSNTHTLPEGVSLSGPAAIRFDWRGEPVSSYIITPGGTATALDSTQTITLTESGLPVTITVTPYTGFVP